MTTSNESFMEEFWSKVNKTDNCWLWTGSVYNVGMDYGRFKNKLAHRIAYEAEFGPTALCVLHKCDVPRCVRPSHLFAGTYFDNIQDMIAKRRAACIRKREATHCKRGHEFTIENTYMTPAGMRRCRTCKRNDKRRYRLEGRIA